MRRGRGPGTPAAALPIRLYRRDLILFRGRRWWRAVKLVYRAHRNLAPVEHQLHVYPCWLRDPVFFLLIWTMLIVTPPVVLDKSVMAVVTVARLRRRSRVSVLALTVVFLAALLVALIPAILIPVLIAVAAVTSLALVLRRAAFPDARTLLWAREQQARCDITLLAGDLSVDKAHPTAGRYLIERVLEAPDLYKERIWITISIPRGEDEENPKSRGWKLVRFYTRFGFRVASKRLAKWGTAVGMVLLQSTQDTDPPEPPGLARRQLARATLERMLVPRDMLRRIETYRLPDAVTITRTTTFETIASAELELERSTGRHELILPLSFARKRRHLDDMLMLRDMRAQSGSGELLSVITRYENARLSYWALYFWLEVVSGGKIDDASERLIWKVVEKPGIEAELLWEEIRRSALREPWARVDAPALCRAVVESEMFDSLIEILATNFVLGVSLAPENRNTRQMVLLSHEATSDPPSAGWWKKLARRVGMSQVEVRLALEPVLATRAMHVEVENPGELIDLADELDGVWDNHLEGEPCAHLAWSSRYWRPGVIARFALRPSQALPGIGALIALTGLLCGLASLNLQQNLWQSGIPLILLFPGAAGGLSAVRRHHSLADQIVGLFRLCIAAGVGISIAAAAAVVVTTGTLRHSILIGLASGSAFILAIAVWVGLGLRWATRYRLGRLRKPPLSSVAASAWPPGKT